MVKFGVGLTAGLTYESLKKITLLSEKLGFDSVWSGDHLGQPFECWTLLTDLASQTKKINVGTLCTCVNYRYPVLLAKIISTLDVISKGRTKLGIGAGCLEEEYNAYGLDFNKPSTRIEQLREATQIIKKFWREEELSFQGKYWNLKNIKPLPKPIRKPHPPLWICLYGNALLKLTAETANGWNTGMVTPEEYKRKVKTLRGLCKKFRRKPEEIVNSLYTTILIGKKSKELENKIKKFDSNLHKSKQIMSKFNSRFKEKSIEEYRTFFTIGNQSNVQKKYRNILKQEQITLFSTSEILQN